MTFKVLALFVDKFIEFRTVKMHRQQRWNFYTVLLQIHSGNCMQKWHTRSQLH